MPGNCVRRRSFFIYFSVSWCKTAQLTRLLTLCVFSDRHRWSVALALTAAIERLGGIGLGAVPCLCRGGVAETALRAQSAPAQPGPVAAGDHASRKRCVDPTDSSNTAPRQIWVWQLFLSIRANRIDCRAQFFFNLFLLLLLPFTLHSCTSLFLGFAFLRFYFVFYFFWFFCLRLGWMLWGPLNSKKSI